MYSIFFQTDYDLYVNHMMASQSSLLDMVKHTVHNVLMIQTGIRLETRMWVLTLFPFKNIDSLLSLDWKWHISDI